MDEKRGISLRKKRTVKNKNVPISAPKQISGPIPQGQDVSSETRVGRPGAGVGTARPPMPRERTPQAEKTKDLVQRRYSTRFTQLPQDFGAGVPPVPGLPSIPAQYRQAPPPRDRGRDDSRSGPGIKVDTKALKDPKLRPDECRSFPLWHCLIRR